VSRPLGFAFTKLNFNNIPGGSKAAKHKSDKHGGKHIRTSSLGDSESSLQLTLPQHGPLTDRSYLNELNQKPSRQASKNDVLVNRVEVELSQKCRLEEGISSNRELNSNFNANDLAAIEGLLHSVDYEEDPETLRNMQNRILQIR